MPRPKIELGTTLAAAADLICEWLPEGWEIKICLEQNAGVVELYNPAGEQVDFDTNHEFFYDTVEDAVEHAIENHDHADIKSVSQANAAWLERTHKIAAAVEKNAYAIMAPVDFHRLVRLLRERPKSRAAEIRGSAIQDLEQKVIELGLAEDALDELVHDLASQQASNVNNCGFGGQLEFLLQQVGRPEGVMQLLEELADAQEN